MATALLKRIVHKVIALAKRGGHLLLKPYYLLLYSYPLWYYVVNRESGKLQEDYPKEYTVVQELLS